VIGYPCARGGNPLDPPPEYARWRDDEKPLRRVRLPNGRTPWLVTRCEDARAVLQNPLFSSDSTHPGYPAFGAAVELPPLNTTFIGLDDPEHARLRRMFIPDFTAKRVEKLRPEIQRIVDERIDRMTSHAMPADLVADFALPVSSQVICLLLGVPYSEHAVFERNTHIVTTAAASYEAKIHAGAEILGLLEKLVAARESEPLDDLTSRLVADYVATGQLTQQAAVLNLGLLLGAGHDTSANMIALSALVLLRDRDHADRLRADPALMDTAVEELLRYLTIVQLGLARVALADAEISDQVIRAGEGVVVSLQAANRDSRCFTDPDVLDLARPDARRHVAFGFGGHQCLGQTLARAELQISVSTLIRRLPALRLAVPYEDIRFKDGMDFYGPNELPVRW